MLIDPHTQRDQIKEDSKYFYIFTEDGRFVARNYSTGKSLLERALAPYGKFKVVEVTKADFSLFDYLEELNKGAI